MSKQKITMLGLLTISFLLASCIELPTSQIQVDDPVEANQAPSTQVTGTLHIEDIASGQLEAISSGQTFELFDYAQGINLHWVPVEGMEHSFVRYKVLGPVTVLTEDDIAPFQLFEDQMGTSVSWNTIEAGNYVVNVDAAIHTQEELMPHQFSLTIYDSSLTMNSNTQLQPGQMLTISGECLKEGSDITITSPILSETKTIECHQTQYTYSEVLGAVPPSIYTIEVSQASFSNKSHQVSKDISIIPVPVTGTLSITNPTNNESFYLSSSTQIMAEIISNFNWTKVQFFMDNNLVGTDTTAPYTNSITFSTTGNKIIYAKALDGQGNELNSQNIIINVVNDPMVSITSPAMNANYMSGQNVQVTANVSSILPTKVEFYDQGVLFHTENSAPYDFTMNSPSVGTHSIVAKAYSTDGETFDSNAVDFMVTQAAQIPSVALLTPFDGGIYTINSTIGMSAVVSNMVATKVEFYDGNTMLHSDSTAPYSFTWTGYSTGSHIIKARAYENQNVFYDSNMATITVQANSENDGMLCPDKDIVIANNGNDSNNCSLSAPCKTLHHALSLVDGIKTDIFLKNGTYFENGPYVLPENACIEGESKSGVMIQATGMGDMFNISRSDQTNGMLSTYQDEVNITLSNFTMDGRDGTNIAQGNEYGLYAQRVGGIHIKNVHARKFRFSAFYFANQAGSQTVIAAAVRNIQIEDYYIEDSSKKRTGGEGSWSEGGINFLGRIEDVVIRNGQIDHNRGGYAMKFRPHKASGNEVTNVAMKNILIEENIFDTPGEAASYGAISLEFFHIPTDGVKIYDNWSKRQHFSLEFNNQRIASTATSNYVGVPLDYGYQFHVRGNIIQTLQGKTMELASSDTIVECNYFDARNNDNPPRFLGEFNIPDDHEIKNITVKNNVFETYQDVTGYDSKGAVQNFLWKNNLFVTGSPFVLHRQNYNIPGSAPYVGLITVQDNIFLASSNSNNSKVFGNTYNTTSVTGNVYYNYNDMNNYSNNTQISSNAGVYQGSGQRPFPYFSIENTYTGKGPKPAECVWTSPFTVN